MKSEQHGRALEKLVFSLEKTLAQDSNVNVHSPMRLKDRTTGRLREHDVVVEIRQGHHRMQLAIECRDRSRPIGVPQIEAFAAKCQDTGINQGVIVSTKGFYSTARTKARHLGIRCLDIEDIDHFDWLLTTGIHTSTRSILSNDWTFYPVEDGVVEKNAFEIVDFDGNILTMNVLTANAQKQLKAILPEDSNSVEEDEIYIRFPGEGLLLRSTSRGETVPVKYAIARIRYSIKHDFAPFQLVKYRARDINENITEAAYADVAFGDKDARVMIVHHADKSASVAVIPSKD